MGRKLKITEYDYSTYRQNHTFQETASYLGFTYQQLKDWCGNHHISMKSFDEEDVRSLLENEHLSVKEIAYKLNISINCVYYYIRRYTMKNSYKKTAV